MSPLVLILGAGEQASGVAHRLFRAGLHAVLTEIPEPGAVRRRVSFASAVWDGAVEVEGVRARRWELDQAGELARFAWDHLPVFVDPEGTLCAALRPDALVDGRLLKRCQGLHPALAPLVIGLGPGIEAGRDAHAVVETCRGHALGRIIARGCAAPDTGLPGEIAGQGRARVLRAPCDGRAEVLRDIGSQVVAGEALLRVQGVPVLAGTAGVVRGMIRPGAPVLAGQKLGDVYPRGDPAACATISEKARCISGAVLELILAHLRPSLDLPR